MDLSNKKILVTGGAGFVGKHLVDELINVEKIPEENIFVPRKKEYDLRKIDDVKRIYDNFCPNIVIHLAMHAKGINYNKEHIGELYHDNIMIGTNIIEGAKNANVEKFVAVGTAIVYPSSSKIPYSEVDIWNGYPEETLAPLAMANKMMLVQLKSYNRQYGLKSIYLIPCNIYGPGDHFFSEEPHFIPAIINKFNYAIENNLDTVECWGTGKASREFIYVKDAVKGIILASKNYESLEPLNIGSSDEMSVKDITEKIGKLMGYRGHIIWDSSKPEGQLRRCLDNIVMKKTLNFISKISFDQGIKETINWFINNKNGK